MPDIRQKQTKNTVVAHMHTKTQIQETVAMTTKAWQSLLNHTDQDGVCLLAMKDNQNQIISLKGVYVYICIHMKCFYMPGDGRKTCTIPAK